MFVYNFDNGVNFLWQFFSRLLFLAYLVPHGIVLFILLISYSSKLAKGVILYAIWAGRNRQSYFLLSAGDRLFYSCYQIYPENAVTICCVAIAKRKDLIFSQLTQLKFSNLNT